MKLKDTYLFGKAINKKSWQAGELEDLGRQSQTRAAALKNVPREYIINVLAETGKIFKDKNSAFRKLALEHLREAVSFSEPVIVETLNIIPEILSKQELSKRMNLELFLPYALETAVERRSYDGLIKAVPRGVALHIGAGNVFLGIIDSLILGMLTKNANIVKISSTGSNFANIFMQALLSCDKKGTLAKSVAVINWKGGQSNLEETILKFTNTVFVWGGAQAVLSYRRIAPIGVNVMGFGPKTSMAIVYENSWKNEGYKGIAEKVAKDVCSWDQSACSSMHTLYFVCPDKAQHKRIIEGFSREAETAFSAYQKKMPQGSLSEDEKVEITKARQMAKVDKAFNNADIKSSFPKTDWTVIYEKSSEYKISPLNRVMYFKIVSSLDDIKKSVKKYSGYIQTIGVGGHLCDRKEVVDAFHDIGIARVVKLGSMLEGVTGSPHDGIYPMMSLINWIGIEGKPSQLERISELIRFVKKESPFYKKHFKNIGEIRTLEDFRALPFLEKNHIYDNTPPDSSAMMTSKVQRGVYFASGGSTGSPKYIFYDSREYDHTVKSLAYTMEAGGLNGDDVIANLFIAGNLWSSWISVEKAIAYTKAISVPVGSSLPIENIVKYLQDFKVTAVIGLPSFLVKLAEYANENKSRFKLNIKKIFYGGEYVGDEMIKFFQKIFPGVEVKSAGFATADAGVIGFQCQSCSKGLHHIFDNSQYMEFVDPETLKPVKPGEIGELVITSLTKRHMPIIRFRLGDLGRWILKPCACGRREPLFEVLGRSDDRIHVGGAHLFVSDIQNAVGKIKELSFNFQLLMDKKGHKDILTIAVEVKNKKDLKQADKISKKLRQEVYKNCEDLKESVNLKWLDAPKIELLGPGFIEKVLRTGKIKRVIDKRIKI